MKKTQVGMAFYKEKKLNRQIEGRFAPTTILLSLFKFSRSWRMSKTVSPLSVSPSVYPIVEGFLGLIWHRDPRDLIHLREKAVHHLEERRPRAQCSWYHILSEKKDFLMFLVFIENLTLHNLWLGSASWPQFLRCKFWLEDTVVLVPCRQLAYRGCGSFPRTWGASLIWHFCWGRAS